MSLSASLGIAKAKLPAYDLEMQEENSQKGEIWIDKSIYASIVFLNFN